jgi:hypothetical protein
MNYLCHCAFNTIQARYNILTLIKMGCSTHILCFLTDEQENMQWPEILKFMFEGASSPDSGLRESALHIFRYIQET